MNARLLTFGTILAVLLGGSSLAGSGLVRSALAQETAAATPTPVAASLDDRSEGELVPPLPAMSGPPTSEGPMPTPAEAVEPELESKKPLTAADICSLISNHAEDVGMPKDFFARLIWKESRFDAKAISPVGARGIAQFMPYTARERGLADPYDVEQAIRHSALYLRDLKAELGNWGLAAAAYNGGINRVKRWLSDAGGLPRETVEYVNAITFRPVTWFAEDGREVEPKPLDPERSFDESCARLPIMKTRAVFASLGEGGETAPPSKPWGVQVAGHEQRDIAMRMFQRVQSDYSSILGDLEPSVQRRRTSPRRRIYAVRIGADSRSEATQLCQRLRGAGGSCIVMKN